MSELAFRSILDLSNSYRSGELSPVAVIDSCLKRAKQFEPKLGAFQAIYADDARAAAQAAEKAYQSGHRIGPFHGIPFALKDIIDVEDRITTGGSKVMSDRISPRTATIACRLLAGGGILIGKTKTVEVAMGGWGTNEHMGTPWNPWDLNMPRTPGGSSSGSGVSVAAGLAGCAVGTDTGGSVRIPSAWCGIVGLKTSEGLLPTDGIIPLSHTLDTPGPMARCVDDVSLMFEVMVGRHPIDTDRDLELREGLFGSREAGIRGLRLGILSEDEREGIHPGILSLYENAIEVFRSLGAEVSIFQMPMRFEDMQDATGSIIYSEGYYHHGEMYENEDAQVDPYVRPRILGGRGISAREYIAALIKRRNDQEDFLNGMRGYTAFITPTAAYPAIPLDQVDQKSTPARFTRATNYLGLCGLSVPMGLTTEGLPGGLQILGRHLHEADVIRVGASFEVAHGGIGHPKL
jgi:aspartyl-tRNA(Asn)/glutamyl-tRNA(Gln) amidotransferase subunit A